MSHFLKKKSLNAYAKVLDKRLSELEDAHASTKEDRAPVELDQTTQGRLSRMDALQVQAMALETDRRREIEIKRVESAIQRIPSGEFGYCVSCGDEIEIKRLDNDPATPSCISCARGSLS
ncbi:MAG: TraR/DksA C4-type zinc finger protein [Rhodospirillales bacterium]|nr:TraR/DksA C4-type zinc finger protein [Rhodospirillales bacterium]